MNLDMDPLEHFMMAYWNEFGAELYGSLSGAVIRYKMGEPIFKVISLKRKLIELSELGRFPHEFNKKSKKAYGVHFPNHHRYLSIHEIKEMLLILDDIG